MMLRSTRLAQRRTAFTLLEILIVVAIIVVLAGIGGYYLFGALESAKIKTAISQMRTIEQAVDAFRLANSEPPQNLQVLLMPDPANDGMPYLKDQKFITDPWGNIYQYEYTSALGPTLWCITPNQQTISNQSQQGNQFGP